MKITYTQVGDYLLPDLTLPEQEQFFFGRYGRMRLAYLKNHKSGLYSNLQLSCQLNEHLAKNDKQANEKLKSLMKQMAESQGVTEQLKADDQMAWVGAMNNIKSCAEEIVLSEIIYA